MLKRIFVGLLFLGLTVIGLTAGFVISIVYAYSGHLPDVEQLRHYQPSETTRVYANNGELIATLFKENRTWVSIATIPQCMRQAIVASEDARFYQHYGIDFVGIARAAWQDYRHHGATQGASTITMQLARSVFLTPDETLKRKVQEALISVQLERKFSKEELLEFYLNQIYFGAGAYGVEAASEVYFNKKADKLTLAEAAMLVGVVPAPSAYSPFVDMKAARDRERLVLRRMVAVGFITKAEAQQAFATKLHLAPPKRDLFVLKMPYFSTYVLAQLAKKYGEDQLYRGGLQVYTTVDPKMQEAAEEAVRWGVDTLGTGHNVHQGALVAVEPQTGFIRAMVGGTGWSQQNQFDRAWQIGRPPGSSFKIFVYSTALEAGFQPDTLVGDTPTSFRDGSGWWTPKNSDGRFMGAIPLRTALQYSRNVVSAKLVDRLTPARVIDTAYKMGISSHIEPNLSIALGAVSVSPLEMASAICTLPNGGKSVEARAIKMVRDAQGNVLEDNTAPVTQTVMPPQVAFAMTEMLENAVNAGTGYNARLEGRDAAGKTGTTDSHRDAWFCGFTPQLVAAVWVGNDDDTPMWGTFGGDIPAPIWKRFMIAALAGKPAPHFFADANGMVTVAMCKESGKRAGALCPDLVWQKFKWNQVPQSFCQQHLIAASSVTASPSPTPTPTPSATPDDDNLDGTPVPSPTPGDKGQGQDDNDTAPPPSSDNNFDATPSLYRDRDEQPPSPEATRETPAATPTMDGTPAPSATPERGSDNFDSL
jgi:1A family penicillin-binding protein